MRTSGRAPMTFGRLGRFATHRNKDRAAHREDHPPTSRGGAQESSMKMSAYFFASPILLGALTLGFGCPSKTANVAGPTSSSGAVSLLSLGPDPVALGIGKSKQLTAVA